MKQRMLRVNQLIQQEISQVIERDIRDSRFGMITVTEVRVSNDLQYAKVYISIFGTTFQKDEAMKILKARKSLIQREVGAKIKLRYTPHLQFVLDETEDKSDRIMRICKELNIESHHEEKGI